MAEILPVVLSDLIFDIDEAEMIAKILAIKICSGEEGAFATNLREGRVLELTRDDSVIPPLP